MLRRWITWARVRVQIGKQYRQAQHVLTYMQAWQSTCLVQGDFSNDCSISTFRSAALQRWGTETLRTASSSEEVQPTHLLPPCARDTKHVCRHDLRMLESNSP